MTVDIAGENSLSFILKREAGIRCKRGRKGEGGEFLKIVIDANVCYGCRACELACSFHHGRLFSPELSSIKVFRDNQTGEISWSVDSSCDLCKGEAQPLCMEYCVYGASKEAG